MSIFKFVTFHFISINKFIGVGTNYVFLTVKIQQGFVFYRFCYFFFFFLHEVLQKDFCKDKCGS